MAEAQKLSIGNWLAVGFMGLVLYSCMSDDEPSGKSASEIAEERRKGFHCLSAWDGSHAQFKREVESRMRDPDSFEHIETRVTPENDSGEHTIFMQYRARNGFGGMNVETAVGSFRNSGCRFTIISLQ